MSTLEHWRHLPGPWAYCQKELPTGEATFMTVLGLCKNYFLPVGQLELLNEAA